MASTGPTLKKMYDDVVEVDPRLCNHFPDLRFQLKNSQKNDLDKMDSNLQAIYDEVSFKFGVTFEAHSDSLHSTATSRQTFPSAVTTALKFRSKMPKYRNNSLLERRSRKQEKTRN